MVTYLYAVKSRMHVHCTCRIVLLASGHCDVASLFHADFILTFQENPALRRKRTLSLIKKEEDSDEDVKRKVRQRKEWRDYFLAQLDEQGMDYEEQEPKVCVCMYLYTLSCQHGFSSEFAFIPFPCL